MHSRYEQVWDLGMSNTDTSTGSVQVNEWRFNKWMVRQARPLRRFDKFRSYGACNVVLALGYYKGFVPTGRLWRFDKIPAHLRSLIWAIALKTGAAKQLHLEEWERAR